MDDRVRLTVELDSADHAALSEIAQHSGRSLDQVAASALRARIAEEREWEEAMQRGMADAAAGRTISHEDYKVEAAERRRRWMAQHPQ